MLKGGTTIDLTVDHDGPEYILKLGTEEAAQTESRGIILSKPPTFVEENSEPSSTGRQRSVRFRSRVRITSGLRHHRDNSENLPSSSKPIPVHRRAESSELAVSGDSSLSSSPSSSISAPLRSQEDEPPHKSRLGPLGQRVHFLRYNRSGLAPNVRGRKTICATSNLDEQTPLLDDPLPRIYVYNEQGEEGEFPEEDDYEARLNREIDLVFGKWPSRLMNRHWWWWQLEPIVRCSCLDESDSDT
ncbi:hypothetical protein C8J56DRAFT_256173 [Mycena floridula]|nr:hypothetical protein C8J56DRAFT_256173 [Mycena floridula]